MFLNHQKAIENGYISREEQLVYQQETSVRQGDGRTCACHELALPSRLSATVLWDRCMDISRLSFAGIPISYLGKSGEQGDAATPFERRFSGGMLYTCGLMNVGPADEAQPAHGRIHLQSATMRSVHLEENALILQGQMRESALFGENLLLKRTLTFPLDASEVRIEDAISNQTPYPQPYMLLYHINLGYPMLSEHLKLRLPDGTQTSPATEQARAHLSELSGFSPPEASFEEQDFHHQLPIQNGYCAATAENRFLGIGFGVRYRADTLPTLIQWRCLRSGDYVLGLEPSNNRVNGRAQAAREGALPVLNPFETITTEVVLSFFDLAAV